MYEYINTCNVHIRMNICNIIFKLHLQYITLHFVSHFITRHIALLTINEFAIIFFSFAWQRYRVYKMYVRIKTKSDSVDQSDVILI